MTKKLYIYQSLDKCDPGSGAWNPEGGLVVVTAGYPNDAVPRGTGNRFTVIRDGAEEVRWGLPEADLVIVVPDDTADVVIPFPDAGC